MDLILKFGIGIEIHSRIDLISLLTEKLFMQDLLKFDLKGWSRILLLVSPLIFIGRFVFSTIIHCYSQIFICGLHTYIFGLFFRPKMFINIGTRIKVSSRRPQGDKKIVIVFSCIIMELRVLYHRFSYFIIYIDA